MDRPKGMEGKQYATWDLDIEKATLKQVVEKDGGDFSKVKLIPSTVTDEVSALKRKSWDSKEILIRSEKRIWIFYFLQKPHKMIPILMIFLYNNNKV